MRIALYIPVFKVSFHHFYPSKTVDRLPKAYVFNFFLEIAVFFIIICQFPLTFLQNVNNPCIKKNSLTFS